VCVCEVVRERARVLNYDKDVWVSYLMKKTTPSPLRNTYELPLEFSFRHKTRFYYYYIIRLLLLHVSVKLNIPSVAGDGGG